MKKLILGVVTLGVVVLGVGLWQNAQPADGAFLIPPPGHVCHANGKFDYWTQTYTPDGTYDFLQGKTTTEKINIANVHTQPALAHQYDIVPPSGGYAGRNWNSETEAIWNDHCGDYPPPPTATPES